MCHARPLSIALTIHWRHKSRIPRDKTRKTLVGRYPRCFWRTQISRAVDSTAGYFSFSQQGTIGERRDWMIGLLSGFFASCLHYSIPPRVTLPRLCQCFPSPPHSTPGFYSRVQVSICFLSRSRYAAFRILIFLTLVSFSRLSPIPKTFLPDAVEEEEKEGWNIRLPNYWKQQQRGGQFLSSHTVPSIIRHSSPSIFVPSGIQSSLTYLYLCLCLFLIVNGNPRRATWTESQIRIFEASSATARRWRVTERVSR